MVLPVVLLLMGVIMQSHAFFHEKSMQIFEKPSSLNETSLFGYSITYESKLRRLVISAPKANDLGKIYTIDIDTREVKEVTVPIIRLTPESITHDFWLGAHVKANSDYFVTCTPRYAELKTNKEIREKRPATVGVCFIQDHDLEPTRLQPITNYDRTLNTKMKFRKLMDSFGWSIDVTPRNELLIGAPAGGAGRVIRYKKASSSVTPQLIHKISHENPVMYNFGYSIASGQFFSKQISYAVSTTFGEVGYGKVYFFNSKLENIGAINDDELGSMFGAALCSANLGSAALLVGAPAFADTDYTHDIGAVYIYMAQSASSSNEMSLKRKLTGESAGAYFGNAIVNLGDMDGDSKDEIAIGAPYDDNGRGAVYIYSGEGILQGQMSQKIRPEALAGFGHSLTVVEDFDENGSNDLAVSSPKTGKIVLLRSVAIITVNIYTKFPNLQDHVNKTHFEFQSCVDVMYPEKPLNISADLIITIMTTDRISKLVEVGPNGTLTYEVSMADKKPTYCRSVGVQSILTPVKEYNKVIAYKVSAVLKGNVLEKDDFDITRVVLSERSVLEETGEEWTSDCGGQICKPDLKHSINSSISTPYLIGSSNMEKFTIFVKNVGQTAYGACAVVTVLEARVLRPPPGCTMTKDNTQFTCKRIEPLRNGNEWRIHPIEIETTFLTSENDKLTVQSDLYNNCNNKTDRNFFENIFELKSDFENIAVKGQANPEEDVNMTRSDVYDLGKIMEHVYTINNNGKTNWIGVKSEIILDNVPYLNYSGAPITISSDKSSGIECSMANSNRTETHISVFCDIGDLKRNQKALVVIAIAIPPNTLEFKEENENVTITTMFNLFLNNYTISLSLQTTVKFVTVPVELWIIIVSSIVGLIILAIISYALYECGFLRRKNKDKLRVLKREVHRQSMRRSMMRESMRAAANRRSTEDAPILKPVVEEKGIDAELLSELKTKMNN